MLVLDAFFDPIQQISSNVEITASLVQFGNFGNWWPALEMHHTAEPPSLRKTRVRICRFSRWGDRRPLKFSQTVSPSSW